MRSGARVLQAYNIKRVVVKVEVELVGFVFTHRNKTSKPPIKVLK